MEDVFSLQLCYSPEDGQHKLPCGGGCIDGLLLGYKLYPFGGQLFYQLQQVLGIAGEAADGLYDDHIAFANKVQHGA